MCNIHYLSLKDGTPSSGYWDQSFIRDICESLPDSERDVVVIPGAYQGDIVDQINENLAQYKKVLVFVTSDEEGKFPIDKLKHPDMYVYGQYGTYKNNMPLGYTSRTRDELSRLQYVPKYVDWFFAGQINHHRRRMMAEALSQMDGAHQNFYPTDGFSKGMPAYEYYICMAQAKTVPCPPGNLTQDSFRVYEALEAGAVPILDRFSAQGNGDYWDKLFPDNPMPVISSYNELGDRIRQAQDPGLRNKVFAWWIAYKMKFRQHIKELLNINEAMTIIVPTSPIPSHPSTEVIDQTIASIRHHTGMDIILTIDGVRPEQEHMRNDYTEYIRRLLWKCNFEYQNVHPILFDRHMHQSGMMKEALTHVRTPLVMYVEHDTPLVTDEPIEWLKICEVIMSGMANVVRFHYEAFIPKEHEYMLLGPLSPSFMRTKQWSQRPHVARTDFYRDIMRFFSPQANCFLEDLLHGKCVEGEPDEWKVVIYTPGENIKRSLNLDGRAGDRKFEAEQIW